MRDFNGAIVFRSILCPKNLTRVKKSVIYRELLSDFRSEVSFDIVLKL